jgi:hypothetical protein
MGDKNPVIVLLESLYDLLQQEKEALISNEGEELVRIVEEKIALADRIEGLKEKEQEKEEEGKKKRLESEERDPAIDLLVERIRDIQQTNGLLAKQALSYHEVLLKSIAEESGKNRETYSPRGGYEDQNNTSTFVDQKV